MTWALLYNTDTEDRIATVKAYASSHPYVPPPQPDHVTLSGVVLTAICMGDVRDVRCIYTEGEDGRLLSISFGGATEDHDVPSPHMTEQLAKLFGFTGEFSIDYLAAPHQCECARPCPPNVICCQDLR